ncbi:MAG TPA: histidinol-phosphate transaminase, partial [Candidatus Goldiibacteriota bacterium]|nr:histidinol-phosphate transaminase [Candidatus Goldiibacteriota bacterium]
LNRYPEPGAPLLRKMLAKKHGLKADNIVIGNGSDELIHYLIQAFCETGSVVMTFSPSFDMYRILAVANGCEPQIVPLDDRFDIDVKAAAKAAAKASIVFIAYPNNPTGNCFSRERIASVIKAAKGLVVIDEAYHEFSGKTFMNEVKRRNNVVVMRTFSKAFSLASIRLGYMAAGARICDAVNRVRLPYNVNSLTQAAGIEALKAGLPDSVRIIREQRDAMYNILKKHYPVVKSDANFLFLKVQDTAKTKKSFEKRGISIRMFNEGRLKGYIRITVGKPEENMEVLRALTKEA